MGATKRGGPVDATRIVWTGRYGPSGVVAREALDLFRQRRPIATL